MFPNHNRVKINVITKHSWETLVCLRIKKYTSRLVMDQIRNQNRNFRIFLENDSEIIALNEHIRNRE